MKDRKLQQLFGQARQAASPPPPAGFAANVLRTIRHDSPHSDPAGAVSLFDQLGSLFPRLALAAALIIALCIAADFGLSNSSSPEGDDAAMSTPEAWVFTSNGL